MKDRLIIVLLLIAVSAAVAATLTVDIPTNDVPRVSEAYGQLYQLGHNASMPEVSYQTQLWIISQTKLYERSKFNNTYVEKPMDMQPTPSPVPTPSPTPTATPTPTSTP